MTFPGENPIDTRPGPQIVRDMDSQIIVFDDHDGTSWDIGAIALGSTAPVFVTSSPAAQLGAAISGPYIVWSNNRLGSWDVYLAFLSFTGPLNTRALIIQEILADPPPGSDANGDGVSDADQDRFVEVAHARTYAVDISGVTLRDATGVLHTFPPGTVLPAGGYIVVFGGGSPAGVFGGAMVETASSGSLPLSTTGGTLSVVAPGGTVIDSVTYGAEAGMGQSILRNGATGWMLHRTARYAVGPYSPGTAHDGFVP